MNLRKMPLGAMMLLLLLTCLGCRDRGKHTEPASFESGKPTISFDYTKQTGYATNQFAVWVEDTGGHYVETLYVTGFTANGGYKSRPESISEWVEKSALSEMGEDAVDAISGATPKAGALSYAWNLTDAEGNAVPSGDYRFFVEGSLRWKNRVLYSGVITVGGVPSTAEAEAEYIYEASDNQEALTADSPENTMLSAVTASFEPV